MESIPLVSVVTPFYNTQAYLSECIESVLRQTYTNWEYVLVDNCSNDGSGEIARRYEARYPDRIRVVHTDSFLSQIQNYNFALSCISPESKYCKIVQADDFLFPECLRLMTNAAEQDATVGVVGAYSLEGRRVAFDGLPYPSPVVPGPTIGRLFFLDDLYLFGSPTQLLLRSDLVRNHKPFYDESHAPFEDAAVVFQLLTQCNFGFVHQVLTFTRRDNPSLMGVLATLDYWEAFKLLMLHAFGCDYLEQAEFEAQLQKKEQIYANLLVNRAISLRGRDFWNFHLALLRQMGYSLKSQRIWRLVLRGLSHAVFSPESAGNFIAGFQRLGALARRFGRRAFLAGTSATPNPSPKRKT